MAKIRVYELAKDLNMTNTALLNKMKELNIEVKSRFSHSILLRRNNFVHSESARRMMHAHNYTERA